MEVKLWNLLILKYALVYFLTRCSDTIRARIQPTYASVQINSRTPTLILVFICAMTQRLRAELHPFIPF